VSRVRDSSIQFDGSQAGLFGATLEGVRTQLATKPNKSVIVYEDQLSRNKFIDLFFYAKLKT